MFHPLVLVGYQHTLERGFREADFTFDATTRP
jgi:hypothetical protein